MKSQLRVGFDLDGVILYNPTRIVRPLVVFVKRIFFRNRIRTFYVPHKPFEKLLWRLLHKSSIFIQPGFDELKRLVKEKKIKAYLITARYSFLNEDLQKWLKKMQAEKYFEKCFYNDHDEQPPLFKEKVIKKLDLDYFIEDNWDIVNFLKSKSEKPKTKILWVYNILDKPINYPYKFPDLRRAIGLIKQQVEKTKVLIVSDFFYPHWTGISKSLDYLTQALKDEIDFTILTVQFKKNLKRAEVRNGVKILRIPPLFSLSRVKYSLGLVGQFLHLINSFDIVFINSPCSNIFPISVLARLLGKKIFIFHQGDLILPRGFFNRIIEKVFDFSSFVSFLLADKLSTYTQDYADHSRLMKAFLYKFTPLLIPLAPHVLDVKSQIKKIPRDKILFGFAGRFVEEKGFDILLEAIPNVLKSLPNAHFVFAGETNVAYEKTFENLKSKIINLKSDLTLLGLLNDHELKQFYKTIDFIIVPSRSDCFNLVQAEAMLAGVPSIVSDIPGARFLVKQTGFGLIFKSEDAKDLSQKIVEAVKRRSTLKHCYSNLLTILDFKQNAQSARKFLTK